MKGKSKSKEQLIQELNETRLQLAALEQYAISYQKIEEELRRSEEMFRLHFDSVRDVVYSLDRDYRVTSISPSVERYLGYKPVEIIGKPFPELNILAPEYMEEAFLDTERLFAGEETPSIIYEFIAKDGTRFFADVSGVPLWVDGKITGIVSVARDITKRKRAEEELRKYQDHLQELVEERTAELEDMNLSLKASEAKYRFLTEKMSDVVWTADMDLKITYVSPSIERLRGITPEERIQMKLNEVLTPESYTKAMEVFQREFNRYQEKGFELERSVSFELEFYHKDGSTVWMDTVVSFIADDNGKLIGVHGVGRDITERKRAEEEKKNLENQIMHMQKIEALNRFAGGIAHDLNNLLYPVIINTEQLLSEAPTDSSRYEILNQTLKASYRQRDLIKQILTFSRKNDTRNNPIKIGPLLEESIDFLRSSLPKAIEIRYRSHAKDDIILGDPSQVQQVILNLCQNAADAMESRIGTIDIGLSNTHLSTMVGYPDIEPGHYLRLIVKDNGRGMNQDMMSRIFEPFYTTKGIGKGTGMGLSVVYGIVKSHKGGITVKSKEGKGSLFSVYLPICDEECQAQACLIDNPVPVQGKERILLIDDEENILASLQRALKMAGYRVTAFQDGLKALELFNKNYNDFDLVITDLSMPGITGLDLSRKMLDIRCDIPIILCTGFNDIISRDTTRYIGIRELLLKPAGIRELKDVICRALEN